MDATIMIEDAKPEWPERYETEKKRLQPVFGKIALGIEHIGSTAVPGLAAKPVLDLMVGVKHLSEAERLIEPLSDLGYEHVFHEAFPRRRFFRKGKRRAGIHHLHIYVYKSEEWKNQLRFRDYLRAHPKVREDYETLKRDLAKHFPHDRNSYTKGKAPFITHIVEKAKREEQVHVQEHEE
ncbi:GrpB family protein [Bacillus glycinifermentans]|uniref:GrpB family protein n=1 Tax=Bacillus glycinifermentans TaxID=1664069 RepID=UPI001FF344D3|nr:GrpB family protein [Bacillus glycinifermentans]UOY90691.1 GrpB family protein [Bacillus glycinifermentans]